MYNNLEEKRLYVLKLKLKRAQEQTGFFKKNLIMMIFSIIRISFYVSFFSEVYLNKNVITITKGKLINELIFTASICVVFCLLGHIIWGIQDRLKIKRLIKEIEKLENEI